MTSVATWLWNPQLVWIALPLAYGWIAYLVIGIRKRVLSLEDHASEDRVRRDKEFQDSLTGQAQIAERTFTSKQNDLAQKTEFLQTALQENMNRFYREYNVRLNNVEMLGVEGPYVEVPYEHWTFLLTTAAFNEYSSWDEEMQGRILKAFTWNGNIRFFKRTVQNLTGDVWTYSGKEWSYEHLAAMPDGERQSILKSDLQIWNWYEKQAKFRADGRRREL